ncbi:MAG: undecaprenyl-diphosphate phosphatase [Bacteroidales bacterium]|jgi:undecaprenyl-diphosphatase|nr:undecaprenyl-diphosphate phosphatase [Bacteroidales bacterium]
MTWIQGLLLGLVQGLTEFLPVSSSGHLTIFQELFGIGGKTNLAFDVTVHVATVLSTIVVFRRPLGRLIKGFFVRGMNGEKDYVFKILVSLIPVAIIGFTLKDFVEKIFSTDYVASHTGNGLLLVGSMLIVTALLLDCSERITARSMKKTSAIADDKVAAESCGVSKSDSKIASDGCGVSKLDSKIASDGCGVSKSDSKIAAEEESSGVDYCDNSAISYWQAFVVGIAQAIAVLPGLSRSGSTISTGLLCKVKKSSVAQFSFLMVIIPVLGEALLDVYKAVKGAGAAAASAAGSSSAAAMNAAGSSSAGAAGIEFLPLLLGFIAAFFAGWAACKWMVKLVKNVKLTGFAIYCAIVGILCIVLPYLIK